MNLPVSALLISWPAALMAGTSANYNLSSASSDTGGLHGGSASYRADFSESPGGAGNSNAYTSRIGYAGQLDEAASLVISLSPPAVAETGSALLGERVLSQAGFLTNLTPGEVAWSILSGPITGIDAAGVVTADKVYQSTSTTVRGSASGLTATLSFTVLETIPDNFGLYAGDRLPDGWQVLYLGLLETAGGPSGDPDQDGYNNLMEFAFGTDPGRSASGGDPITYSGGVLISRGQPITVIQNIRNSVDFRVIFPRRLGYSAAGLRYQVQFSPDLIGWTTSTAIPSVVAQDTEYEAVAIQWPFFINGRKTRFFRILIDFTPIP